MKYTVTIDDASPIIRYSGLWSNPGPEAVTLYSGDSYHSTQTNTSFASFNFTGTAVAIFGSKGPDHSKFSVTLDGSEEFVDGFSSTNLYQTSLFSKDGLALGKHTVTIRNTVDDSPRPWLYLDYVEFVTGFDDRVANAEFNVDDSNSTIVYSPAGAWSNGQDASLYYSGTYHTSNTSGSTISTWFEGNAISIFGAIGPDYGTVSVNVDENITTTINCSYPTLRPQTLLYYSNDFASGRHSLVLTIPNNSTQRFDFDYITVSRWSDNNGLGSGKALTPIIAGSVCGAIILLAWLTYLGHWYYLRRQKRKNVTPEMLKVSDAVALQKEKKKDSPGATGNDAVTPEFPNPKSKEGSD